ncbi:MAG: hypothetical protein AAGG75_10825 [Bacteroidota bacterium]
MTYHINVKKGNIKEFLQIIRSLRSLGIIESFESTEDLVREGQPIEETTLLNILQFSENEIVEGKSFSMEEVKKQIEAWKNR